ncbi:hypothetical protein ASZ78_004061 [Callipepla squamata]|uniref:Carboxylic ester hydrolase n=1 Tax=Callipepla squamata TaxID=9009 RepID=A0A226N2R8_CALSU|nr:hypothetical protein ASZ78_004061 [Callipepla squamata]
MLTGNPVHDVILCTSPPGQKAEQPEVVTKYGTVRGYQIRVNAAERSVNVFLGLPFAKPPVGPLRFSEPQPPEPWRGVRDATSYPPMCLQNKVIGQFASDVTTNRKKKVHLQMSEDCLYLNIYTPVSTGSQEQLPVFVWIHGGGLVLGAASTYDGSALAAFDNVVVVTIQYRLGIVGYFSTGDKHARGNWGYLDQVAALQWIQENIVHFGGDPGSVTIGGGSAGGISVSALILSPLAKGLFHRAISESGTAIRSLFTENPEKEAQPTLFISASVDGVFLPMTPRQLLSQKKINAVPYIVGVNNCEFGWGLPMMMKFPDFTEGLDKEVARQVLQSSFALSFESFNSDAVDRVFNEYIGKAESRAQVRDGLLDALGDYMFVFSAVEVARYHRGESLIQHRFRQTLSSILELVCRDYVRITRNATEEENKLSRTVMKYWTNFARNGNPNGEGLVHWPLYDLDERYLEIDLIQKAAKKLKEQKMEFWVQLTEQMRSERRWEHTDL